MPIKHHRRLDDVSLIVDIRDISLSPRLEVLYHYKIHSSVESHDARRLTTAPDVFCHASDKFYRYSDIDMAILNYRVTSGGTNEGETVFCSYILKSVDDNSPYLLK